MRVRQLGLALVFGGAVAACGSSTPSPSTSAVLSPLCADITTIHDERAHVGEAFAAAFAGDLAQAGTEAGQIRARLLALETALPPKDQMSADDARLREAIVAEALVVDQSASWINDGLGDAPDLATITAQGRTALETGDASMRQFDTGVIPGLCPGLALSVVPVAFPTRAPALDPAALGIPPRIGLWALTPTVQPVAATDPLGEVIAQAGGDIATATHLQVEVADGANGFVFDAFVVPGATLASFARASQQAFFPSATARTTLAVPGWTVWRFEDPKDPTSVIYIAGRGDRLYSFGNLTREQAATLLAGLR